MLALLTIVVGIIVAATLFKSNRGENPSLDLVSQYWKLGDTLKLISASKANAFSGPLQWPQTHSISSNVQVFRVEAQDGTGQIQKGWLRLEYSGMLSKDAVTEVIWDSDNPPLFSDNSLSNYLYFGKQILLIIVVVAIAIFIRGI